MDSAPATIPASAAIKIALLCGLAAATPTAMLLVEIRPSFAPSTAARSQPMCSVRCRSRCMAALWMLKRSADLQVRTIAYRSGPSRM